MQKKEINLLQPKSNEWKGMNKILSRSMVLQLLSSKYHMAHGALKRLQCVGHGLNHQQQTKTTSY